MILAVVVLQIYSEESWSWSIVSYKWYVLLEILVDLVTYVCYKCY